MTICQFRYYNDNNTSNIISHCSLKNLVVLYRRGTSIVSTDEEFCESSCQVLAVTCASKVENYPIDVQFDCVIGNKFKHLQIKIVLSEVDTPVIPYCCELTLNYIATIAFITDQLFCEVPFNSYFVSNFDMCVSNWVKTNLPYQFVL